jgi:hypothetical protein
MKKLKIAMFLAVFTALVMATGVFAIFFSNGDFESGTWTPGWDAAGQREFLLFTGGYDPVTGLPNMSAGGADLSLIVPLGGAPALSIADPNTATATNPTGVLMYPAVGNYSARINSQESWNGGALGQSANTLYQSSVVDAGDIDGTDNMVHLRLLYAAVMVEPDPATGTPHSFDNMPMFFLEVKDETTGAIILHKQSYVGEPGIPWQAGLPVGTGGTGNAFDGTWKFLDWSYVDIIAGESTGPNSIIGHTLSVKIIATGCSPSGHPGYVYVDELGSSHVGVPAVVATGPATRNTGQSITYTYTYFNGASSAIDATITVNPPAGVTFTSANPACTANGLGGYSCTFPGVAANGNGSFNISGTVTALGGSTINHGDYNIAAAGYPTLTGPVVITNVPEVPANTPPVAVDDGYNTPASTLLTVPALTGVLANDTDADTNPLTAALVIGPLHDTGSFTLNTDGSFNYTPVAGFLGADTFTYVANDGLADSNIATVTINIRNTPPVITEGDTVSVTMSEDNAPTPFALTLHATDADGNPLTWSKLTNPTFGSASINATTGVVKYTSPRNYYGPDAFNIQVVDGLGGTDTITVNVTITPVEDLNVQASSFWIVYNNWRNRKDVAGGYFGDAYISSQSGQFNMTIPTGATKITFTSSRGPDQGNAEFRVDGITVKRVSLYNATEEKNYPVVVNIPAGGKTLTVVAMGTKNAASTGTWVLLDAYQFSNGIKLDTDLDLALWKRINQAVGSDNYDRQTSQIGSVFETTIIGQRLVWETYRGPDAGTVEVYLDGVLIQTIDLYSSTGSTWHKMYTFGPYPYGTHTFRFVVVAKNPLSSNSIVIVNTLDNE